MVEGDLLFHLVLPKEALDAALRRLGPPQGHTEVGLFDLVAPDFLVEDPQGLRVLGGDDDAPGVPVNAVAQGRGESVLPAGIPLLLLIEVSLDVVDQGVDLLGLVGMAHKALPLVRQEQVFVLVNDGEAGLEDGEEAVFLRGLVEELVVDVELQHVPVLEPHVPLGALAVDLHPLEANVLLGQGRRQQGKGLPQEAVQPLSCVIFSDGDLPHGRLPPCRSAPILAALQKFGKEISKNV